MARLLLSTDELLLAPKILDALQAIGVHVDGIDLGELRPASTLPADGAGLRARPAALPPERRPQPPRVAYSLARGAKPDRWKNFTPSVRQLADHLSTLSKPITMQEITSSLHLARSTAANAISVLSKEKLIVSTSLRDRD